MTQERRPLNLDAIFQQALSEPNERPDLLISSHYDGPVPEAVLYQLLSAVEQVFVQDLQLDGDNKKLLGLRLCYNLQTEAHQSHEVKVCWVGWGKDSFFDKILGIEQENTEGNANDSSTDIVQSSLSDGLFKQLLKRLNEELLRVTPSESLAGKILRPFVLSLISQTTRVRRPNPEGYGVDILVEIVERSSASCVQCGCGGDLNKAWKSGGGCEDPLIPCCK